MVSIKWYLGCLKCLKGHCFACFGAPGWGLLGLPVPSGGAPTLLEAGRGNKLKVDQLEQKLKVGRVL